MYTMMQTSRTVKDVQISARDILEMVPMKNQKVEVEHEDDTMVILRVPLRKRWFNQPPFSWILPISRTRRIELTTLGRQVWGACDGKRTVEDIVEEFSRRFNLTFHESRLTVTDFLRNLSRRGIVAVVKYSQEEN
jgi:hypothetical protein